MKRKITPDRLQTNERVEVLSRKIDFWRDMTSARLSEIKSINFSKQINIQKGVDFDNEVQEFEIQLIKQALKQVRGNQKLAARLLNIKYTTLNAKIKRYSIEIQKKGSSIKQNN